MSTRAYRVARVCLRTTQLGAVLLLLGPLAYRLGLVGLLPAFGAIAVGVLTCLVALIVTLTTWRVARGQAEVVSTAATAAFVSVLVLAFPVWVVVSNLGAPPIHHITTDPGDPPEFVAVIPLRGESSNPLEYPGGEVEAAQREAYPDLRPLVMTDAPRVVFARALQVVDDLGWELVASAEDEGRIEATAITGWFGFKDDVVIRIRSDNGGSRVDLRSVSRIGQGDLGANAARIRAFIARLES